MDNANEPKKTWYEAIQEMSKEELARFLTDIYADSMVGAEKSYLPWPLWDPKRSL